MPLPDSIVEAGARALFLAADTGGDPKVRPNSAEDWDSLLAEVRAGTLPEDELDSYYRQARICFAAMLRACAEEEAAHATSLAADAPAYVSALLADIEERDGLLRQVLFSIERARHEDVSADRCFDCTEWPDLPHHPECLITRIRAVLE